MLLFLTNSLECNVILQTGILSVSVILSMENDCRQERGWYLGDLANEEPLGNSGGLISEGSTTGSSTGNKEREMQHFGGS